VTSQVVSERPVSSVIQTLLLILGAIGLLSLGLSIFLIINTVSAMVVQQTRLIGVMKTVGASGIQILWMYLAVAIFYGLIALIFSIPISILGSQALSQYMANTFNFTVHGNPIQSVTILVQAVMALLVPILSSFFPLINGLSISVTQALSSGATNQVNYGANLIDRLLSGTNLWFARYVLLRPVLLALRNVFRQKVRLGLTLITLVVAGAVFITIFNLRATIFESMNKMTRLQSYDLEVDFSREYRIDEIQQEMGKVEGIKAMDTWFTVQAKRIRPDNSEKGGILVTGLHPDSKVLSSPEILEGRWLIPGDQNVLVITTSLLKNEPDLKVGDNITLNMNDRDYSFQIVGDAMAAGIGGDAVYANYDYISELFNNKTRTSTALIKMDTASGINTTELKTRLDSHFKNAGYLISSIQTTSELKTNMKNNFNSILVLLIIMALLLAVVGGLGLMGTMSINVIERTREIGVMRAIGSSNGGVNSVFITEGVSIGVLSCLISIPVSFPISRLGASAIGSILTGTPWASSFALSGFLIWIVIIIILSLVANYFPARSASRLTVREVLAYE
jgi:putative ABC transport system permease protein